MSRLALALAALTLPLAATAGGAAPQDWLAAHNAARATVGVPPLVWSKAAEQQAKAWARTLGKEGRFDHSGVAGMGENLYISGGSGKPSAQAAVDAWVSERQYFNPTTRLCNRHWSECGHYTQVVWRQTTAVGCATAPTQQRGFDYVVVCNYTPQGNWLGEAAY